MIWNSHRWYIFIILCMLLRVLPILAVIKGNLGQYSGIDCCVHFSSGDDGELDTSKLTSTSELLTCVNSSVSFTQTLQPQTLTFAMFASPAVYQFAAHNVLANSMYFESQGFAGRMLGIETGDDFYPNDRRWNKVRSIMKALHPIDGWASHQKSLVYIDTDLVILDWDLDPETILMMHPDADLLLSSDALDIGNSGFLILRNTLWLRNFISMWWESRHTQGTFCDQHVLNKLYHNLKHTKEAHKIAILAPNEVNSRWPAMETFGKEDRVLHLMGETPTYRTAVARYTSHALCVGRKKLIELGTIPSDITAKHIQIVTDKQLGFTKEVLVDLARGSLKQERDYLFEICQKHGATEIDFDRLHEAITNSCDDKRPYLSSSKEQCEADFLREYYLAMSVLEYGNGKEKSNDNIHHILENEPALEELLRSVNSTSTFRLYLAEHMTKILYDIVYFTPSERKREAADRVLQSLNRLANHVDMNLDSNKRYIKHKRGLLYSQLSTFYLQANDWESALADGIKAIDELGAVMAITMDSDPDFSGFVIEYIECASKMAEILLQLHGYSDAAEWAETALTNAKTLYENYSGEKRVMAQELARLHLLVAETMVRLGDYDKAKRYITLSRITKLSYDSDEHSLSKPLQDKENRLVREIAMSVQ